MFSPNEAAALALQYVASNSQESYPICMDQAKVAKAERSSVSRLRSKIINGNRKKKPPACCLYLKLMPNELPSQNNCSPLHRLRQVGRTCHCFLAKYETASVLVVDIAGTAARRGYS